MRTRVRVLLTVGALAFAAFPLRQALAGFLAMPVKAELDLAKTVGIGKITDIAKEREEYDGRIVVGRATIALSEVLKGQEDTVVPATVVMHMDHEHGVPMQSPEPVYRVGDEGIWVIMRDGRPSHAYGLLKIERLDEVKAALAELDGRVWSEEVTGLKVWAGATYYNQRRRDLQGVVFAVKNVSNSTVWLPRSLYSEVVTAIARDSAGREFELPGMGQRLSSAERPPVCRPLEPGETRYMHPDTEDYGFFGVPRDLPPGKYTVTVTLANSREGVGIGGSSRDVPIHAWKGKVAAPQFDLEIPRKPDPKPNRE